MTFLGLSLPGLSFKNPVETLRNSHRATQHRPRELFRLHRLCEQKALHQIEPHLTHRDEILAGFDAFGDGAGAVPIRKVENLPAHRAFQPIVGATGDELPIDFELDEWKVIQPDE